MHFYSGVILNRCNDLFYKQLSKISTWYKQQCLYLSQMKHNNQNVILFIWKLQILTAIGARWSSGSALQLHIERFLVRIPPWPKMKFSGHKKWISEASLDLMWIGPWKGGICASLIFLGAECWLRTNREWNRLPIWTPER